jgi:hypothetical protein
VCSFEIKLDEIAGLDYWNPLLVDASRVVIEAGDLEIGMKIQGFFCQQKNERLKGSTCGNGQKSARASSTPGRLSSDDPKTMICSRRHVSKLGPLLWSMSGKVIPFALRISRYQICPPWDQDTAEF